LFSELFVIAPLVSFGLACFRRFFGSRLLFIKTAPLVRERERIYLPKNNNTVSCVTITAMAGCQRRRRPIKAGRL